MITGVLVIGLIVIAVAVAVLPLISRIDKQQLEEAVQDKQQQENLSSYQELLTDIDERVASGVLSEADAQVQKAELQQKLLGDSSSESNTNKRAFASSGWVAAAFVAVLIPVVAVVMYNQLGAKTELAVTQLLKDPDASFEDVTAGIEQWAEEDPDNDQALYLLGSQYLSAGKLGEAVTAYRKLYAITGPHAQISAQLAQVVFLSEDRSINAEVRRLYNESLSSDPANTTALGLKGIDSFEQKQYAEAVKAWQAALAAEENPQARQALASGIYQARKMLGDNLPQVTVKVDVAPELKSLPPETRVIVFARESGVENTPPLAAVPTTVGALPTEIVLDDTSTMMVGGRSLSDVASVDIAALITLSGDALKADYRAEIKGVSLTAKEPVALEIQPKA